MNLSIITNDSVKGAPRDVYIQTELNKQTSCPTYPDYVPGQADMLLHYSLRSYVSTRAKRLGCVGFGIRSFIRGRINSDVR